MPNDPTSAAAREIAERFADNIHLSGEIAAILHKHLGRGEGERSKGKGGVGMRTHVDWSREYLDQCYASENRDPPELMKTFSNDDVADMLADIAELREALSKAQPYRVVPIDERTQAGIAAGLRHGPKAAEMTSDEMLAEHKASQPAAAGEE